MYNILPQSKDHIIAIHIEDRMDSQDCQTLLPYLKHRIENHRKICLFIELKDFNKVEFIVFIKTLFFTFKYRNNIEKKAFVTDEEWVSTWAQLFSFFSKTKVRCFPSTQIEQAWEWARK